MGPYPQKSFRLNSWRSKGIEASKTNKKITKIEERIPATLRSLHFVSLDALFTEKEYESREGENKSGRERMIDY